ncbi:MAG: hypothetical protein QM660_06385 [Dysgonomonas sp.]
MPNNQDKDKDCVSLLDEIKLELLDYIDKRVRLFKLDAFEKIGITTSTLGYGLIVSVIISAFLFFMLFGLAFFIGELLNSLAAGFGILALFSILVLVIILLNGKRLRSFILNKTIVFLHKIDKNEAE